MKRIIAISSQRNAEDFTVINTIQNGDFPSKSDVSQVMTVGRDRYMDALASNQKPFLLPQNVRWCSGDRRSLLIEEAPSHKIIQFRNAAKLNLKQAITQYKLPMPWLYYGISPDKNKQPYVSHLWCTREQLSSKPAYLYFLPIPNIFKTGAICTHTLADEPSDAPYHTLVNIAISDFWNSIFNLDVNHYAGSAMFNKLSYIDSDIFRAWQSFTLPKFMAIESDYWTPSIDQRKVGDLLLKNNDFYNFGEDQAGLLMSHFLVTAMENQNL